MKDSWSDREPETTSKLLRPEVNVTRLVKSGFNYSDDMNNTLARYLNGKSELNHCIVSEL